MILLRVMFSLISFPSRSAFLTAARTAGLFLIAFTVLSGGQLRAQNPHEVRHPEIAYFNDFKLTPEAHEAQELSIGIDLVNGNYYNDAGIDSPAPPRKDAGSGLPNPFRTAVLIMGIAFVVTTFAQALIPLIKSAGRAPVPVGMAHEN